MNTPIADFMARYAEGGVSRLHMPGHKGAGDPMNALDITEIRGADSLYEAQGIILESEKNAAALFGSARTLYSTEGSSQCVRAMLYLALTAAPRGAGRPVALAGRNAHRTFIDAAALCDFDVDWLYPEAPCASPCACPITPDQLARRLDAMAAAPFCVYVTSPDYLGHRLDIAALARVCRSRGVPLLVDNAHGAYLRFLEPDTHPLTLGAALCCDSAHKTLPVLTGGAYLHIGRGADPAFAEGARRAMALFGSTSPSYLILRSLDLCNAALAGDLPSRLGETARRVAALKDRLTGRGFTLTGDEPTKLTVCCDGAATAARLRAHRVECEYAGPGHVVLMFTPDTPQRDYDRVERALDTPIARPTSPYDPPRPPRRMTIRQAMFAPQQTVPTAEAVGRVCAAPTVGCPPAVPIAVSGEEITPACAAALRLFGQESVSVVRGAP